MAEAADIPFFGITSRRPKKGLSPGNILTAIALIKGFVEAIASLRKFKPDLVIGTGGYASVAVVMAQAVLRGKTLIHESNIVPGRANLWLSRFATSICVGFVDTLRFFNAAKTFSTGMPIRQGLLDLPNKREARKSLKINSELFTVTVIGGSQGAATINRVVAEAVPMLKELPIQVLHQTGPGNYEQAKSAQQSAGWDGYHVYAYFDDMAPVYASTDLVLCRSGASTIAEVTAIGLPSILVPYPHANTNEQMLNAKFVAENGGAIVIENSDLTPKVLSGTVAGLLKSPDKLREIAEAAKKMGRPHAAQNIAQLALSMIENNKR